MSDHSQAYSTSAYGGIVFAAMLMILAGTMQFLQGLVALVNDDFYVRGSEYLFRFDLTTWGWIHLVTGLVLAFAGAALLRGAMWARTLAVVIAGLSIFANFLWLPYYPVWSLTVMAFDLFVMWALIAHGRDVVVQH
ncbi:MAG TPA: hypothetical protein VK204_12020 [Nocardioidaceae bacterium]|nr:hypothetical protein [Nocardioidaceae bacterium]